MKQPIIANRPSKQALFRVHFHDGATVTTTAGNSLHAEQKARRLRPGLVESIRIVRGKR
ncbi:hypothetical protein [Rhizobium lusitanum]|uniref:Uncharacterized protein n=1 Tax=Rhizobium lusitanum TaxID=293958 RepID=A0A1C3XLC1_9HYPH|nr:hypothetical protein [Rhizobium lusitanum]SCB53019.1 hypothetical protein GA0061101_16010 [Rhizobium lusitanum]